MKQKKSNNVFQVIMGIAVVLLLVGVLAVVFRCSDKRPGSDVPEEPSYEFELDYYEIIV